MDKSTTATNDHALEAILRPFYEALANSGITPEYLVKKLKVELNAKETKTVKIKGAVGKLGRGFKVVTTTGLVEYGEDGKKVYGDGETLIRSDQIAWGIRQRARMDAQKLMDLYPAEKVKHSGEIKTSLDDETKEILKTIARQAIEAQLKKK